MKTTVPCRKEEKEHEYFVKGSNVKSWISRCNINKVNSELSMISFTANKMNEGSILLFQCLKRAKMLTPVGFSNPTQRFKGH